MERLSEMSKTELENLINRTNKEIQTLENMKQESDYKNNPNTIEGFDAQIRSAKSDLEVYQYLIEQKSI